LSNSTWVFSVALGYAEHTGRFFKNIEEPASFSFFNSALTECHFLLNLNQKKGTTLMIARFNPRSEDLQCLLVGPIAPFPLREIGPNI
jgi:hypothetical protein